MRGICVDFGSNHSYFVFRDYLARISGGHPPFSNVGFALFLVICTGESDTTEGDNEKVKALCFLFSRPRNLARYLYVLAEEKET